MIVFDLKNAFDAVNWIYLFQRMREVGINSDVINLISKLYRSAKFGSTRKEQRVDKGVSQGSLISTILFLLVKDPLLRELQTLGIVSVFADDTDLITHQKQIPKALKIFNLWYSNSSIYLNKNKCALLTIGKWIRKCHKSKH